VNYFFEWDPWKEKANRKKHGISFTRAATIFLDPYAITIYDERHSTTEERWITMGVDDSGILLVIAHMSLEEGRNAYRIRIISARKASRKERDQYSY
jgi:uncharacterized DUF497 family protein